MMPFAREFLAGCSTQAHQNFYTPHSSLHSLLRWDHGRTPAGYLSRNVVRNTEPVSTGVVRPV